MKPVFLPSGDRAIVMQWGDSIDEDTNAHVIAFAERVRHSAIAGIVEIVPTYRSLLICYDPEIVRGVQLEDRLRSLWPCSPPEAGSGRLWRVPCLYGGEVGQDLEQLAAMKDLRPDQVMALHSNAEYRVYMIGFAPGFAYLGGLPEVLYTPRLATPRQAIPAGAVGIGGQQANINSVAGPSGWRFIGWTPWPVFDSTRSDPFLFRAGDRVRFQPVDTAQANAIAAQMRDGTELPRPESEPGDEP